jgi:hypothetical protein
MLPRQARQLDATPCECGKTFQETQCARLTPSVQAKSVHRAEAVPNWLVETINSLRRFTAARWGFRVDQDQSNTLPFMIWLSAFAVVLALTGAGCIAFGLNAQFRRPDLTVRLLPFHSSVGDEAEAWLKEQ